MKKLGLALTILALAGLGMTGCSKEYDIACEWCRERPTRKYITSTGVESYICKDCRTHCFYCDEKATRHATNAFDMEIFMCDDCYKEMLYGE